MTLNIEFMMETIPLVLKALPLTAFISVASMAIGGLLGLLIGLIRYYRVPVLNQIFKIYVSLVRGFPLVIQLYIAYFCIPYYVNMYSMSIGGGSIIKNIPPLFYAVLAFSINTSAYVSETFRSSLEAIEPGQHEACKSIGMTEAQSMFKILIPQALATATPNLVNLFVGNIKGSTLAYMISVHEMMGVAVAQANKAYRYIEVYIITAVIYWALCFILEQCLKKVEIRQNRYKVRT